jgi:sec-independent protein translocase protein TatA
MNLIFLLLIVLLLFGGKKLPEVASSMGKALRAFKDEANKLQRDASVEESKATSAQATPVQATTVAVSAGSKDAAIDIAPEAKGEKAQ